MSPEELDLISQLSQLPLKSTSRRLIGFINNKNLLDTVFGKLLVITFSKQLFVTYLNLFVMQTTCLV